MVVLSYLYHCICHIVVVLSYLSHCGCFIIFVSLHLSHCGSFIIFVSLHLSHCGSFIIFVSLHLSHCVYLIVVLLSAAWLVFLFPLVSHSCVPQGDSRGQKQGQSIPFRCVKCNSRSKMDPSRVFTWGGADTSGPPTNKTIYWADLDAGYQDLHPP